MGSAVISCLKSREAPQHRCGVNRPILMFANSDDIFVGRAYLIAESNSFQAAVCGSHIIKQNKIKKLNLTSYFKILNLFLQFRDYISQF